MLLAAVVRGHTDFNIYCPLTSSNPFFSSIIIVLNLNLSPSILSPEVCQHDIYPNAGVKFRTSLLYFPFNSLS